MDSLLNKNDKSFICSNEKNLPIKRFLNPFNCGRLRKKREQGQSN